MICQLKIILFYFLILGKRQKHSHNWITTPIIVQNYGYNFDHNYRHYDHRYDR